MTDIKRNIYYYNTIISDMSSIEQQLERNSEERRKLKDQESIARITKAISSGDKHELLKASASFVSRNQKKSVSKPKGTKVVKHE